MVFTAILCICVVLLCLLGGAGAEKGGDTGIPISIEPNRDLCAGMTNGVWQLTVQKLPPEAMHGMAVLLILTVGDHPVPKISLAAGAEKMTLTVGKPVAGQVVILLDGCPSTTADGTVCLLLAEGNHVRREWNLERGELWYAADDGAVISLPLSVVEDDHPLDSERESDLQTEGERPVDTASESTEIGGPIIPEDKESIFIDPESDTEGYPGVDPEEEPNQEGETEASCEETEPVDGEEVLYLGCRESVPQDGCFSVRLLFWCDREKIPAVICFGGGEAVSLSVESLGDTSVVACTYRGLAIEGDCRFYVDTAEGTAEILYRNGIFIQQLPCNRTKCRGAAF